MANRDSPNNNQHHLYRYHPPNPFMHYPTSDEHGRTTTTYSFHEPTVVYHDHNPPSAPNTTLVQIPRSSFYSRNLQQGESSSSSSSPSPSQPAWLNNSPRMEDTETAMGGLSLSSNPFRRNTADSSASTSNKNDVSLRSGSNGTDFRWEDIYGGINNIYGYEHEERELQLILSNLIAQAAAAASSASSSSTSTGIRITQGYGNNNKNKIVPLGLRGGVYNNRIMVERRRRRLLLGGLEGMMRGQVLSMARDQCGCRFLQMKVDEGIAEVVEFILSEVKDHSLQLMTHNFGNYLIQKIFEAKTVSAQQLDMMLGSIVGDEQKLKHVCFNDHGTRVVQIILREVNKRIPWQICRVACVLGRMTVPLIKNINASYVIQVLVTEFPVPYKKAIFDEVARSCVDVSTDSCGCSTLQRCVTNAPYVQAIWLLVESIALNAAVLAEDPFGNYVVQYVIQLVVPPVNSMIVSQLSGRFAQLCMNRYASHVVEQLLTFSEESDVAIIVEEIMFSREFLHVLQDQFGNFVVQKALACSEYVWQGYLQTLLINSILSNYGNLHSHLFGKRVLTRVKGCKIRVQGKHV